jgi:hypothetical protein
VEHEEVISKICSFMDSIGIPHEDAENDGDTFLPGLQIENGKVRIDRKRLTYPGDLLHEAGHIALTRPDMRPTVGQEALAVKDPAQSEEMGVILWTYLAAKEIGVPVEMIFHAGGYKGHSNWLIDQFEKGNFIGLPLLGWMGVTELAKPGEMPLVKSWLRVSGE